MVKTPVFGISILLLFALSCKTQAKPKQPQAEPEISFPFTGDYDINSLEFSNEFETPAESRGRVENVTEASGLANSIANQKYVWTHEDSGADAEVILLSKSGAQVVVRYKLKDAQNIDWEDMAIGPGPQQGVNYLYLADIGDNDARRNDLVIYRIQEPIYSPADSGTTVEINILESVSIAYPEEPRDAEALMVDPLTKEIYIVSKREDSVQLFELAYPQNWGGSDTLRLMGTFPFTGITAADVSADGNRVLLKSYSGIFYWKKDKDESLAHLLSRKPLRVTYDPIEFQGEAICWDGNSFFTLSEKVAGVVPRLYFYKAK